MAPRRGAGGGGEGRLKVELGRRPHYNPGPQRPENTNKINIIFHMIIHYYQSSYNVRRPQNFAKSSPYLCTVVKIKMKFSQNFVAFSEYMNFMNEK